MGQQTDNPGIPPRGITMRERFCDRLRMRLWRESLPVGQQTAEEFIKQLRAGNKKEKVQTRPQVNWA